MLESWKKSFGGMSKIARDDGSQAHRLAWGQPRFFLLLVPVVAQCVTIWISWRLWEVRVSPPNLPLFAEWGFPMSFTWTLMASLALIVWFPRVGIWFHLLVLMVAAGLDQFRIVPQVFLTWMLMAAVVYDWATVIGRWYLVSVWFWAGLHKLLSSDWLGYQSFELLSGCNTFFNASDYYLFFAWGVGLSELLLGLLAWFRPCWAAFGCLGLHLGIALFLTLFYLGGNDSVIPWNFAMAIVGFWILKQAAKQSTMTRCERVCLLIFLILPCGFYFGLVGRTLSHVLYSGNIPQGYITRLQQPNERILGWGNLQVPFPNERRIIKQYFSTTASPGEKLHIRDPRPWLADQYWLMTEAGPAVLNKSQFLQGAEGVAVGMPLDDSRALFALSEAGAVMRKKDAGSMVFAIIFPPEDFKSEHLNWLSGLPNLEQVQLSGTGVTDDDMEKLGALPKLMGVGLDNTSVTDAGIEHLESVPELKIINYQGTTITDEAVDRMIQSEADSTSPHEPR